MEATVDISNLIVKLQPLQHSIPQDKTQRKELYSALQNLSYVLETPIDTIKRISYLVSETYNFRFDA